MPERQSERNLMRSQSAAESPTFHRLTDFMSDVILLNMNPPSKTNSVRFTTKGQVVIPAWLRKEFEIEDGTRAIVQATPDGILLRPVTGALIRRARGLLKRKPGSPPFAQEWARHKAEEGQLEERRAR
jgi:AbrB family looped-hinge helix DNA binding protein